MNPSPVAARCTSDEEVCELLPSHQTKDKCSQTHLPNEILTSADTRGLEGKFKSTFMILGRGFNQFSTVYKVINCLQHQARFFTFWKWLSGHLLQMVEHHLGTQSIKHLASSYQLHDHELCSQSFLGQGNQWCHTLFVTWNLTAQPSKVCNF